MGKHISYIYILKQFDISTRTSNFVSPVQVFWHFLEVAWIKVNTDEAAKGAPSFAICGGTFRGNNEEYVASFSDFLGIQHVLYVEVMSVIFAIEYDQLKPFKKLWLECESSFICQALVGV